MYATDVRQTDVRQTDIRQKHRLMPRLLGAGHNNRRRGGVTHWCNPTYAELRSTSASRSRQRYVAWITAGNHNVPRSSASAVASGSVRWSATTWRKSSSSDVGHICSTT